MRLDKFLCELNIGTRSQVKALLKQGLVTVNGVVVKSPDVKLNEHTDCIKYKEKELKYTKFVYYMLNKPAGVVSATNDNTAQTVVSLLGENYRPDIFPVGRLDKDTTGLLLLTNDGELSHKLLSPRKHVGKTYLVSIETPLHEESIQALEQGVDIGEDKPTLPAKVEVISDREIRLTICEGKFHQVKRMLIAVDNRVLALKRVAFGSLVLDATLKEGEYRPLTEAEIASLRE